MKGRDGAAITDDGSLIRKKIAPAASPFRGRRRAARLGPMAEDPSGASQHSNAKP
jgi:hypothetical protein